MLNPACVAGMALAGGMKMKTTKVLKPAVVALSLAIIACSTPVLAGSVNAGNGWSCTANNIQTARYSGGSRAYIHLRPYKDGKRYKVTLNASKTRATGKTSNGTSFACSKG